MHFHIPSYFDKTQTRHVGLLAIARWTGLVLCRNALWDSFEDARTIYVSYYKVAQEAGSKFVPQTFRQHNSTPNLHSLRSNKQLFFCKLLTVSHHLLNVVRANSEPANKSTLVTILAVQNLYHYIFLPKTQKRAHNETREEWVSTYTLRSLCPCYLVTGYSLLSLLIFFFSSIVALCFGVLYSLSVTVQKESDQRAVLPIHDG